MDKKKIRLIAIAVVAVMVITLVVVFATRLFKKDNGVKYPDYPLANSESESWEQWRSYDDEIITIDWFVNQSGFSWPGVNDSLVADVILEKTGIKINFDTPSSETDGKLSTMIGGDMLPDVITLSSTASESYQLANSDMMYSLDELAKRWAPKLTDKISEDLRYVTKAADGDVYGIPSLFYSEADVKAYETQGGKIQASGAMVARKDYLEAYCAYKKSLDSTWTDVQATSPEGFIEMCKWVQQTYDPQKANPTVLLQNFDSVRDFGTIAMTWLFEYFGVPWESASGAWNYLITQPEAWEVFEFLNNLYNNNLIKNTNFSANASSIADYVAKGLPFVFVGNTQDFINAFKNWAVKDEAKEYVPIILTNGNGDAPLLHNYATNGYRTTMISTNCKRPDRVIKLFDYLMSDEGKRLLYYGVEAENATDTKGTYYYTVKPGETVDGVTYTKGQISFTNEVFEKIQAGEAVSTNYGMFNSLYLVYDKMYMYMTATEQTQLYNYSMYVDYNLKAALTPYTFNNQAIGHSWDGSLEESTKMATIRNNMRSIWYTYIPKIVSAPNANKAKEQYNEALTYAKARGLDKLIEFQNNCYQKYKKEQNVTWGYPKNDSTSFYHSLEVTSLFGDTSYYKEVPSSIVKQ